MSSSQIAFGYGGSSASIKSYGNSWGASNSKNSQGSAFSGMLLANLSIYLSFFLCVPVVLTWKFYFTDCYNYNENFAGGAFTPGVIEKEYKEPWVSMILAKYDGNITDFLPFLSNFFLFVFSMCLEVY